MQKPVILVVLDGWGIGPQSASNPMTRALTPTLDAIKKAYPVTSLEASGIAVGLPWGEIGNSEVGHLTIGAGRVLYQYYPRISLCIREKKFNDLKGLQEIKEKLEETGGRLHLLGLISDDNIHASIEHAEALNSWTEKNGLADKTWLHLFLKQKDGKPGAVDTLVKQLPQDRIATASGWHYSLDREENWPLTQKAYEALIGTHATKATNLIEELAALRGKGFKEDFLEPTIFNEEGIIKENDVLLFWNFREDSISQIASCFGAPKEVGFPTTNPSNITVATITKYKDSFTGPILFPPEKIENNLGKIIADQGKTQLRVAETYKHAHVTSFFNSYREEPYKGEYRVLIPSIATPHPDENPELVAEELVNRVELGIKEKSFNFIVLNLANGDVMGHTGNYKAAVQGIEIVDTQLARLYKHADAGEVTLIITSDHGNVEQLYDPQTGRKETSHDENPVPFYLIDKNYKGKTSYNQKKLRDRTAGSLADVAPTILELMAIKKPDDMSGVSLLAQIF